MTTEAWLQAALTSPDDAGPVPAERIGWPHARLVEAAVAPHASAVDLAALLRDVLRSESLERGFSWKLPLPEEFRPRVASAFDQAALIPGPGSTVRAVEWRPPWLAASVNAPVDACVRPTRRRPREDCAGDPILSVLELSTYTSGAQRDAVRAVLCAQPGETIAICLPTGAGKSLCAFLPALLPMHGETGAVGVSVIVVPTVALALDLEERMETSVGHPIAYRPEEPAEAEAIRTRCEAGVQGPLLVSPEALGGDLLASLRTAADRGSLRYFVVDEAHITLAWGDEFRPAFLRLAAVRQDLAGRGKADFVTLLLSATLTDYHLRALTEMFAEKNRFRIVHAARLRPEPDFWMARASNKEERKAWIEEAICRVPRPAIVYTTKRDECEFWHGRFAEMGFRRLGKMTGATSDKERRRLLREWNADRVDLVVATSAFGLGVDKGDVRTIIHAQLPESVDRFYQDVGRAGRDGNASLSLLVTTPDDWPKVARLGKPGFISTQLGVQRWSRMYQKRHVVDAGAGISLVNLQAGREVDMRGDHNRNWNMRTLQLLQRAGALEFVSEPGENSSRVAIQTRAVHHLEPAYWATTIANLREDLASNYAGAGRFLARLGQMERECVSGLFADCYASPSFGLYAVKACGGCPWCRAAARAPFCGTILARRAPPSPPPGHSPGPELTRLFAGRTLAMIDYSLRSGRETMAADWEELLRWLAGQGIRNFVLPTAFDAVLRGIVRQSRSLRIFRHDRPPRELDVTARQPTVVYLPRPEPPWWGEFYAALPKRGVPTVLVAPDDQRCPEVPGRALRDVIGCPVYGWTEWANRFVA